jgi:hypothetical protein
LDFVNSPDDIKRAFEPFYKSTELINPVDVNYVYTFRKDIKMYNLWTEDDEAKFYDVIKCIDNKQNKLGILSNIFKNTIDRYGELEEEKQFEARGK